MPTFKKIRLPIIISIFILMWLNTSYGINPISENYELTSEASAFQWDLLAAISGIAGLLLIFLPYVSILGLLLCVLSFVFGIKARRKGGRKLWIWLGFVSGGLGLLAFLGVVGLILFF